MPPTIALKKDICCKILGSRVVLARAPKFVLPHFRIISSHHGFPILDTPEHCSIVL